ncbi:DNA-binding NtrC family response regulator [Kerstersia gyiorum]|uniref:DNA-binding NtrC family response regulator n=1 Tax=Kerstersia gyiorum TaxID=206506 RepID=A0A4Q7MRC3_9BURK|nr:sigma-54 dependent transcriptional regulator [Kerstersia gyiorum]KAB0543358.1 sigma-54-dependent Fis family transcriptional regulator [Kerstersia gyiorum]RZS70321.1 DNA-binding NtrC family response regulator [Kerstersia gyiorum]
MTNSAELPEFELYVWEGSADIVARIERVFADLPATIIPAEQPGVNLARDELRPAVALVSVSVMANHRFQALEWLSAQAIPVIWIAATTSYRSQHQQFFPPEHSHTLPAEFSHAEVRNMVLKLVSTIQPVAAPPNVAPREEIIAVSLEMRELLGEARMVAGCHSNVLIYGETGVGKERVARYVHEHSERQDGPFVAVNCGAIPETLFEAEFFGHVKGAFTGAMATRKGYFEQASGGTLFLDEIGELPLQQQVKLLRVLESRRAMRVGSSQEIELDFRLVAATNRDLVEQVRLGAFRADLYYRLAVIELYIPSLDERGPAEKIALFRALMARYLHAVGIDDPIPPDWMLDRVAAMCFPGNVREMLNLVERLGLLRLVLGNWNPGRSEQVFSRMRSLGFLHVPVAPADEAVISQTLSEADRAERMRIIAALEKHAWRRQETAAALGISRKALWEKMRKLQIQAGSDGSVALGGIYSSA